MNIRKKKFVWLGDEFLKAEAEEESEDIGLKAMLMIFGFTLGVPAALMVLIFLLRLWGGLI